MSTHQMRTALSTRREFLDRHEPGPVTQRLWSKLCAMIEARKSRQVLATLDDRMLADIGVGRGEAIWEADRAAWDLAPPRR